MNNFVKISITGKNPKLFIKRYVFNKITYSNYVEKDRKTIIIKILYDDYLKLSNNALYEIKILNFYGPIKYINFIKNNYTLVISFFIGIIFLLLLSNISFDIDVIHNDKKIRTLVTSELKKHNIDKFRFIPSFIKRKKIIDTIINENKNVIEWLEIQRKGSKLIVKVTQRKYNKKKESTKPRHIVAKKSGIIIKIESSSGVILKKKNDYVSEGDVIISGDIIKDETVKGQVRANGKVYAETWYLVNVEYPLNYKEIIYLNEVKTNIIASFLKKEFSLRKNYAESYLEKKKVLIKSKVFPFNIRLEKQRKTKVNIQKYSKDQATKKAVLLAEEKILKKLNADEYIISKKTLNFRSNDSKIIVDVFFKVCENITSYKAVDENLLNNDIINEQQ